MSNKTVKTIVLAFTRVLSVNDSSVTVRTRKGEAITIPKPFDKSLKVKVDGEGTVQCPRYLLV